MLLTVVDEETTNGLDEFVQWDEMEKALDRGEYDSKRGFKDHVRQQFEEAGVPFTEHLYRSSVIPSLFPEHRRQYRALPDNPISERPEPTPRATRSTPAPKSRIKQTKLNPDLVREIRVRAAAGETLVALGAEYGVRHNTLSDLVHRKTWKDVA